jgi:hypothetical protein
LICCGWPCCRTRQSLKDDVAEREEERHRREMDRKRAWAERKRRAAGKQLEELIKRFLSHATCDSHVSLSLSSVFLMI